MGAHGNCCVPLLIFTRKAVTTITPKKEKVLAALLSNNTMTEAAEVAGVSRKTIYNYLNDDKEFKQKYEEGLTHLVSDTTLMFKKSFALCVKRLQHTVTSDLVQPAVQVQACRAILDYGLKLVEIDEIDARLQELERLYRKDNR